MTPGEAPTRAAEDTDNATKLDAIPTLVLSLRHGGCRYRGPVVLDRWTELRHGRLHGEGYCPWCGMAFRPWVWRRTVEGQGIALYRDARGLWNARRADAWMIGHTPQEAQQELLTVLPENRVRSVRGRPL
jgi:hypothetical protein